MLLPRLRLDLACRAIQRDKPHRRDPPAAVSDRVSFRNRGDGAAGWSRKVSNMNQIVLPSAMTLIANSALSRLQEYLDIHGSSLDALIRQARADPDVDEKGALRDFAEEAASTEDATKLVLRLRACIDELFCTLGEPIVDIEGAYIAPDIGMALCWHAARLTDLERDLKFAFHL